MEKTKDEIVAVVVRTHEELIPFQTVDRHWRNTRWADQGRLGNYPYISGSARIRL